MVIIGVDYHPSEQYIAFVDTETGECGERQLNHNDREAEKFMPTASATGSRVPANPKSSLKNRGYGARNHDLSPDGPGQVHPACRAG